MSNLGLVAVSGIIGVGKTTLAGHLSRILNAPLICEEYGRNPFLPRQLAGDREAALASEVFFLMSRASQLARDTIHASPTVVCDYLFNKNRIFARMNLNEYQMSIYDELERQVEALIARPDLVVYLYDTTENCLQRIHQRGRDFERSITKPWLDRLQGAYEDLFRNWSSCPVLRIDCRNYDVRNESDVRNLLGQMIRVSACHTSEIDSIWK
ncbi:MAG: Deoxyguanosine kinase [Planctomycetes bacterium ADurb.Bin412]|nr:MAG: Deoxyguanosine kinase [Planctomycetes bacterium ADurb.Bin412]